MADEPVMLITGTSRGIGRYLVDYYVDHGYRVVGCARKELEAPPSGYWHFSLDVSDEAAVVQMFSSVRKEYGRLDALVNNAGISTMNHFMLTPGTTMRSIIDVNLIGTMICSREAAKVMQRRGYGRIINLSSIARPLRLEGEAVYAASKAAIESLTQVLAKELAGLGITVNAMGPTPLQTDLIKGVSDTKLQSVLDQQAIKRLAELEDVSNVLDFFLQSSSGFVTGQVLYLGGC